jgi:hypothetical protein
VELNPDVMDDRRVLVDEKSRLQAGDEGIRKRVPHHSVTPAQHAIRV